ncbi:MAG TPA: hypothetical protein VNG32_00915 [Candidatus Dormibacteraeota bacterium]|nr:hypothetical protein [Candidatus Dormibacteraeota bacterium]
MPLQAGPELGVVDQPEVIDAEAVNDTVAILQEELGIDEDAARDLADIQIICPAEEGGGKTSSFGDFAASKHGAEHGASRMVKAIANEVKREKGKISHEEALVRTVGSLSIIRDDNTGKAVRVSTVEAGSKKK